MHTELLAFNMLDSSEEHKKKRSDMMEKEFNKVFDNQGKPIKRYDEEPAKPLILAASKHPENVVNSDYNKSPSPSIREIKKLNTESKDDGKSTVITENEDSLMRAEREMDQKLITNSASPSGTSSKYTDDKPVFTKSISYDKTRQPQNFEEDEEEDKNVYAHDDSSKNQKVKEKSKSFKVKEYTYEDESDEDIYEDRIDHRGQGGQLAKSKKFKKFVVNTRHCRQERETLQYVIDLCRWYETTSIGDGNLVWYGVSLRDCDIDIIRSKPKLYFNRYPGSELLARKKILCNIMNRMEKYFGEEYEFTPLSYMLPEEEDLLDEDMLKYKDMWYIAKPSQGRGGDGIFLVNKITDIPRWHSTTELLVQHYITDPILVDKKKFDLRVYVLVKGLDPLE